MIVRLVTCWQAYLLIAALALFTGHFDGAWWFVIFAIVSPILRNVVMNALHGSATNETISGDDDPLQVDPLASPATDIIHFVGYAEHGPTNGPMHYFPPK